MKLIQRYVLYAVLPYFGLSLILLSVALIAQQTSRFAEIIGTAQAPLDLISEVLLYLFPSILVFTVPTATLVGTLVGFSRMNSDSELTAMRAAGFGTASLVLPTVLFGLALSAVTFFVSFQVAPHAARQLRVIGVNAALRKLESPVEPRTFYTELAGKVVFVREGNSESGEWGKVFIHWQDQDKVRLVTARSGRIDATGGQVELVLSDAEVITLPELRRDGDTSAAQITTEFSTSLRMKDERLDAGRKALLRTLEEQRLQPEEMGWRDFKDYQARGPNGDSKDARAVTLIFQRRLALCFAPLAFAFFGTALGLRARRGGRGLGFALSIVTLISYYLVTVATENLARANLVPPEYGAWTANTLLLIFALLLLRNRGGSRQTLVNNRQNSHPKARAGAPAILTKLNWGLLDVYVLRTLAWTFFGSAFVLTAVFQIFTLFDLLRFLNNDDAKVGLITRYLFFMLPYAAAILIPLAVLVAVLATFALMSRRNEVIAWWASGQSVYRLSLPALLFAGAMCVALWQIQETVLPFSNPIQNSLRTQIRGGGAQAATPLGQQWVASPDLKRIYSYMYDEAHDELDSPITFEFDDEQLYLRRVVVASSADWKDGGGLSMHDPVTFKRGVAGIIEWSQDQASKAPEGRDLFKPALKNPSEMSFKQLSENLKTDSAADPSLRILYAVNLERKRSDSFSPLVLALVGVPMAFAFGKRNAVTALSVAVALGLAYWASASSFYYLGVKGMVPPTVAAWAPAALYSAAGAYLLFRSNT